MAVIQDININVHGQPSEKRLQTFLRLSQNENGRMINFRVLGAPLPSGCTATFSGTKPDGNVYSTTGTVAGNFVMVQEDMQMTAVAGVWDAALDVVNGTHNIVTAIIRVIVERGTVAPGSVPSNSQLDGYVAQCKSYAEQARMEAYGSPLTAETKAQMTDHTRVYVYTGSEPNMVAGNWYRWNGTAWVSGGVYNAVAVQTDTTLSVAGKAADGKATGDALDDLKEDLNDIEDRVEALEQGGTGGVSTSVRQALLILLKSAAYMETGLSDEIATIESWATEITALSVSPSTASISGSGTQQLTATTTPAGGTVVWSSSNTAVATVSSGGLVTGVSNGTATITASCGDKTASCTVTVSGFATLVSIDATYTQTETITTESSLSDLTSDLVVVATYDNSTTATLTSSQYTLSGTLTVGTSTITVSYGGKTTTFTVTVTHAVTEELWINDLGNTGSTASFSFAPFAYPSDVYAYDYTKQITAIEGDFTNSGSITVGYYSGDITQGVAYDSSKFTVHEVLSVSATGVNKLELTEPLQIPSDAVLAIGRQNTDGATFKYGGTKTKGFVYKDTAGGANKWKDQNKTLGLNIYRI